MSRAVERTLVVQGARVIESSLEVRSGPLPNAGGGEDGT